MSAPKRRRWPTELKMPLLVEGKLLPSQVAEAFSVLAADGPEIPMTLAEVVEWLSLHVHRAPHSPSRSTPPGTRDARSRRRYSTPAGRPGRIHRTGARSVA